MDVHDPGRSVKPYIAIAVGDAWLRSEVVKGLASFYSLAEYPNISRALAGCREHVPLAVLVSEELPTSSGYDFVFMLRLDAKLAAVPVVVLVAKNDKPTHDAVAQCGADKLLVHPFTRSALVTTASGLVNRAVERKWKKLLPLQRQALTKTLELFNGISNVIASEITTIILTRIRCGSRHTLPCSAPRLVCQRMNRLFWPQADCCMTWARCRFRTRY
jgi:DNA-binding response OmpR family regulator